MGISVERPSPVVMYDLPPTVNDLLAVTLLMLMTSLRDRSVRLCGCEVCVCV